jgi:MFS family permease
MNINRRKSEMNNQESNTKLTKRRWIVLTASCVANLCIGAIYAWSVFAGPMAEHLNMLNGTAKTSADLAVVFSICNGLAFITMIAGGYLDKKLGAKWIIFIGVVAFGLGFVVCGFSKNVATLIIGFSIICGLANGFAYVCTVSNTVKFFPDKKGLAGGISTASFGISSVIVPPIANVLNNSVGVCRAFTIFGVAIIVIGALCSLFIINCPDDFAPDGWNPEDNVLAEDVTTENKTAKQMLSSPIFYAMIGMMFIGCSVGLMVISEASGVAQNMIGMTTGAAALVVSALALFNTGGRIVVGGISDRIGRINAIAVILVLMIGSLLMIYFSGGLKNAPMFCIGICLIGFCYGAFIGIYPAFTSDQFGVKYSTLNFGIMFIGFSAAGFAGPMMMQRIFNNTGSYRMAFLAAVIFAVAGLAISFIYRVLQKKKQMPEGVKSLEVESEY